MKVTIRPSSIKGVNQAPPSKSSMQRACAAALLTKGKTIIHNPGQSEDDKTALHIIEKLGATVHHEKDKLIIQGRGKPLIPSAGGAGAVVHCGESGLSMRMFVPIAALSDKQITFTGEGSLVNRPMDFFDSLLPLLGVNVKSNQGKLPLTIQGPLIPKDIEVDGSLSSQFLTGLLMAYGSIADTEVSIKVQNLKSKPYIDLTLDVMKKFNMRLPENKNYAEFIFHADDTTGSPLPAIDYFTEADWSSAAFLLVAGAIAGPLTVRGLDLTSSQPDKKIVEVLMWANAAISMDAKGIHIKPAAKHAFELDATDCPDLFPPLVALAAYCRGVSKIKGVSRLIHKESNRAAALQQEFAKMGVMIEVSDDVMIVHGGSRLSGARVHSHHDHRIAMALAVAALQADGETVIEEAQAVKKSYPAFYYDLKSLEANVSLPFDRYNFST
jgi:3-phosphoshikimate 1-carboxyvinyltransferase